MEIESPRKRPQRNAMIRVDDIKKTIQQPEKLPRSKTLAELSNDAWKRCKKHTKSQQIIFQIDQYVMAKMMSFSPWPAKITGFTKNRKKAYVYFFGTNNSGSVEINEITSFHDAEEVIRMQLLRHLSHFAKGIKEVETELGIPVELSIFNRYAINNN